jgi:ATPase subunit of ABC transporter with duplicated ATPase domains
MTQDTKKIIYSMVNVSKSHGQKQVLKDISLSYFYGAKIGVLGLNGSGKSSLLKILAGVDSTFSGETILSKGFSVGYLEQEPLVDSNKTVREIVEQGVKETVALLNEYEEVSAQFAEPMSDDEMEKLIEKQGQIQEKLDHLEAWDLDSKLKMAMDALRCPPEDTKVDIISGG